MPTVPKPKPLQVVLRCAACDKLGRLWPRCSPPYDSWERARYIGECHEIQWPGHRTSRRRLA